MDGCAVAVFLAAGLLQWVEYDGAPQADKNECPNGPCINFWDAFYFVIVTVCWIPHTHFLCFSDCSREIIFLCEKTKIHVELKIVFVAIEDHVTKTDPEGVFVACKIIESEQLYLLFIYFAAAIIF